MRSPISTSRPFHSDVVALVLGAVWLISTTQGWAEETGSGERIVDRVVAVVGAAGDRGEDLRIVTDFELEVEAQLVLAERAHSVDIALGRPLPERLRASVLETIINYLLIESEASRLALVSVSDSEVDSERRVIERRAGGEGALEQLRQSTGAPVELIDTIIRRRALVSLFIQRNIQLVAPITELDVDEAYARGDHPFGDRPLEEIRSSIETYLTARRQRERLTQWLEEARRRSRVWIIPL